jgi:hypothetical protein
MISKSYFLGLLLFISMVSMSSMVNNFWAEPGEEMFTMESTGSMEEGRKENGLGVFLVLG